jgi:hypothetical protein
MKRINYFFIFSLLIAGFVSNGFAQDDKSKRPSPPRSANGAVGDLEIVIDYGAPYVKGRTVFGGLEAYGKVWRTGANEATTFTVNKDVTVDGKPLPAGRYALFTIPEKGDWTVIFNKNADQWGSYDYDKAEDVLRITVKSKKLDQVQEQLMFDVDNKGKVQFRWEYQSFDFFVSKK